MIGKKPLFFFPSGWSRKNRPVVPPRTGRRSWSSDFFSFPRPGRGTEYPALPLSSPRNVLATLPLRTSFFSSFSYVRESTTSLSLPSFLSLLIVGMQSSGTIDAGPSLIAKGTLNSGVVLSPPLPLSHPDDKRGREVARPPFLGVAVLGSRPLP